VLHGLVTCCAGMNKTQQHCLYMLLVLLSNYRSCIWHMLWDLQHMGLAQSTVAYTGNREPCSLHTVF
jgi:hypothetical protein